MESLLRLVRVTSLSTTEASSKVHEKKEGDTIVYNCYSYGVPIVNYFFFFFISSLRSSTSTSPCSAV